MITCKNIKLRYRGSDVNALNGVSFTIPQGQTVAIVGHNGAGKSTLIKAIAGLVDYEGEIDYEFDKAYLNEFIHVQMQSSHFEKGMKVKDIIKFYLKVNKSKESIDTLLEEFQLSAYKNTLIERLSGGERQRLAILLVLIGESKVIIFDEITTGLDSVARRQVWDHLKRIKEERNLTVVLTSHFLEEVEYLADKVIIMGKGEVITHGSVDELIYKAFSNTREIHCILPEGASLEDLNLEYSLVNNNAIIQYLISEEYDIYKRLNELGAYNIEIKQRRFEDAFLALAGYTLNGEGE